jgi:hypothetical protein
MISPDLSYGPTYRPRDQLTGCDLTEWSRVPLFALARHFQELHRLYGVAHGLRVQITRKDAADPSKGLTATLKPGTAYDPLGRPLEVREERTREITANVQNGVSHLFVLRAHQPEEGPLGIPVPVPRRAEFRAIPQGKPPETLAAEDRPTVWDVPLAGLRWDNGTPRVDLSFRATAVRSFRRPYIASGTVPAGTTAVPFGPDKDKGLGWRVWVDTSAAGFLPTPDGFGRDRRPPVYLVTVGRPTLDDAARLMAGVTVLAEAPETVLHEQGGKGPTVYLSDVQAGGFMLTVRYPDPRAALKGLKATPLDVYWVGVETRAAVCGEADLHDPAKLQTEGIDMGAASERLSFQWPRFEDGRLLTAEALNDVQTSVRRLQWLHNRTLHDWGVAEGCSVNVSEDKRGVDVGVGYALDVCGRELLVSTPRHLPAPAAVVQAGPSTARTWWLTVSYSKVPRPREGDPACRLEGVPIGHLPEAVVRWRNPQPDDDNDRLRPGLDVILATVTVEQGVVRDVTSIGRRSAVPRQRPYIFAGRQDVSDAKEVPRPAGGGQAPHDDVLLVKVRIDTQAGAFVNTPLYLVTIEAAEEDPDLIVWPSVIVDARNTEFSVILILQSKNGAPPGNAPAGGETKGQSAAELPKWSDRQQKKPGRKKGEPAGPDQGALRIAWVGIEF